MNSPRRFIQIVQIILIAVIVKATSSSALSDKRYGESNTELNVIVVINNSNAESYCRAPPNYTPQKSESAKQSESTPSSVAASTPQKPYIYEDTTSNDAEFKKKVLQELNVSKVHKGNPTFTTDFYLEIKKMIMPLVFEKERSVPRYKYTVLFPTKVEYDTFPDIASILLTFRTASRFEHSEIGSADLWFLNGNCNPIFNLFRMRVQKVRPDGMEEAYKDIIVEGGELFNVPLEPMGKRERLKKEDKWFFISDVDADADFRIAISCVNCDREQGPAMKDFNPFILVKKKFAIQRQRRSKIPVPVDVKVNSYCYMPLRFRFSVFGNTAWIFWPKLTSSSYCKGTCTDKPDPRQSELCPRQSNFTTSSDVLRNCCVPTKASPLEVIYLETPNIAVYEGIPDFIIEECGCHC